MEKAKISNLYNLEETIARGSVRGRIVSVGGAPENQRLLS